MFSKNKVLLNNIENSPKIVLTVETDYSALSNEQINVTFLDSLTSETKGFACLKDKRIFIMSEFLSEHPETKVTNYERLISLIGLSTSASNWYKGAVESYSNMVTVPEWLKQDPTMLSKWEQSYAETLSNYKEKMRYFRLEEDVKRNILKKELSYINSEKEKYMHEFIEINPVSAIDRITPQSLPMHLIEDLTSLSDAKASKELRNRLEIFKLSLIRKLTDDKDGYNIESLKEELLKLL